MSASPILERPLAAARQARPELVSSASSTAGRLYEEYYERVLGYCLYKLGSRPEAEDAAQTTFLWALRGLEAGIEPRMEANWLFTIAQNACRARIRTRGRKRDREVLSDPQVLQQVAPGRAAENDELLGLEDALREIPDLQRRAILLREWRGLSYREIAETLDLSLAAVETLIFRARRSLAKRLEYPVTRKKAGAFAFDIGSIASALKSLVGLGTGAKAAAVASSVAALAIGVGVAGDAPKPRQPVKGEKAASIVRPKATPPRAVDQQRPAVDAPDGKANEPRATAVTSPNVASPAPEAAGGAETPAKTTPATLSEVAVGEPIEIPVSTVEEVVTAAANRLEDPGGVLPPLTLP